MIVGCPKEIMSGECRVGMTPDNVRDFIAHGHTVLVEQGAGERSGFSDDKYIDAGAQMVDNAQEI